MASFDFVDAAAKGYEFVWVNRVVISKFAFPVIFVKIFCLLTLIVTEVGDNILRQGLVLLPGTVMEAVFLVGLVRFAHHKEPFLYWGYTRHSRIKEYTQLYNERQHDLRRRQSVHAAVIYYIIINLSMFLLNSFISEPKPSVSNAVLLPPTFGVFVFIMFFLTVFVWSIRLLIVYIPVAMDYTISEYLRKIEGVQSSIFLFLCLMITLVPLLLVLFSGLGVALVIFADFDAFKIIFVCSLLVIGALIISSITTLGFSYGIKQMMENQSRE